MSSRKDVIIFLDTDKYASPFDILVAIDLYPDAQIFSYSGVEVSDAQKTNPRRHVPPWTRSGAKHTNVFIGGQDVEKALAILKAVKKSMFPPFELSVIIDPRGAYTTASAAVVKTLKLFEEKVGDFKGKTATILAGTGPVGVVAAKLYASEGGNVILTSRKLDRAKDSCRQN